MPQNDVEKGEALDENTEETEVEPDGPPQRKRKKSAAYVEQKPLARLVAQTDYQKSCCENWVLHHVLRVVGRNLEDKVKEPVAEHKSEGHLPAQPGQRKITKKSSSEATSKLSIFAFLIGLCP